MFDLGRAVGLEHPNLVRAIEGAGHRCAADVERVGAGRRLDIGNALTVLTPAAFVESGLDDAVDLQRHVVKLAEFPAELKRLLEAVTFRRTRANLGNTVEAFVTAARRHEDESSSAKPYWLG